MLKFRIISTLLAILLFMYFADAEELPSSASSVRSLGMGGAQTAVARKTHLLWYNPAGLAQVDRLHLKVFDGTLGLNGPEALSTFGELQNFSGIGDFGQLYGKYIWSGFGYRTGFVMPHFGVGYYNSGYASLTLDNPSMPELNAHFISDTGFVMGTGFSLPYDISAGLLAKRILRGGSNRPITLGTFLQADMGQIMNEVDNQGVGFGFDLSLMWTPDWGTLSPIFTYQRRDIGGTHFALSRGAITPDSIDEEELFGVGLEMDIPLGSLVTAFDYRHINRTDQDLGKKLHAGVELNLPMISARAGLGQGYTSYGASVDLFLFTIDAATYGVERGQYPGQLESRRYQIELSMEFSFDADFRVQGTGERRRLKQRR